MIETPEATIREPVTLQIHQGVATITLANPAKRNALSRDLVAGLATHLAAAAVSDEVAVIVLTHSGTTFCAGADLSEVRTAGVTESDFPDLLVQLATLGKPTIARINGAVRAGGIGLMAACDIVLTTDLASFGFPEVRLGVVAAVISTVVLPHMSSRGARELFLTGERFDAERGLREGLVTAVVDENDLDAVVARYARSLRLGGPDALTATKQLLLDYAKSDTLSTQVERMHILSAQHFGSDEAKEGMSALRDRRAPQWARDVGPEAS